MRCPKGKPPKALDAIADVVLAYKPKPKSKPAKRRKRLAENGASAREIAAVLGHKSLAQVTLYTDAADRARLAGTAIARLARAGGQTRPKGTKRDR